jgi:hypothetical protein
VGFSAARKANNAPPTVRPGLTVGPNPSLNRTRNGVRPWPRGAHCVYPAPRGQGHTPLRAG